MTPSTYVIALSGPSGAGKSTVIQDLINLLGNAVALRFDDYIETSTYPQVSAWLEGGTDPDEFITPKFVTDVRSLKNGGSILHPETNAKTGPVNFVVIEEPFGKARAEMRTLIDFHVQIEIPLEVALARKILRDFLSNVEDLDEAMKRLQSYINFYLRAGRALHIAVRDRASQDRELLVDGTLPSETTARTIFEAVMAKRT
jgi:uridine kinase